MSEITYQYTTDDGAEHRYTVQLVEDTANVAAKGEHEEWTALEFNQCEGCAWDKSAQCPVAVKLEEPVKLLNTLNSFEQIDVEVQTPDRAYKKRCSVQEGLGGLFGLVMAQSGCPVFDGFKGLSWFHLPFANYDETLFRVTSAYLLRRRLSGDAVASEDEMLKGIEELYEGINRVNRGIAKRLKAGVAPKCDSPVNAIVLLDSMGSLVPISVKSGLEELKGKFL